MNADEYYERIRRIFPSCPPPSDFEPVAVRVLAPVLIGGQQYGAGQNAHIERRQAVELVRRGRAEYA